jgi:hypothetical protein
LKNLYLILALLLIVVLGFTGKSAAQQNYFFPDAGEFNPDIPSPIEFLGYDIGSHHTRTDRIVSYFQELARLSDRVAYQEIGQTYGYRPLVILTITSPENHTNLDQIREQHVRIVDPEQPAGDYEDQPVIVYLGFGVHGNETSSSETAMLTAYYLTASLSDEVAGYLNEGVFFVDPVLNPDGRDRHTHWANMHKGNPLVSDPLDREHNEGWPNGRTNHYWFDLNRDWLPLVHPESKARIDFHHKWYPNVTTDFHEMGTNSTYFFEPTKPIGSENPLLPREVYTVLTETFAGYYAETLDEIGSLYFTKEVFDNTYPGYGSTYPNFQGGLGLVFEQASARGHIQDSDTGVLTFPFAIRNQLRTSLATIQAAVENKEMLLNHQRNFFTSALDEANDFSVNAYVFGDSYDRSRTRELLNLLLHHRLEVYELSETSTYDGITFEQESSYIVPANQPQYRMVRSVFEKVEAFADSTFYGTTAWSLALGYGLPHAEITDSRLPLGEQVTEQKNREITEHVEHSSYSYLLDWSDYYAPKALYHLQKNGVIANVSFVPFTANTSDGSASYSRGSISVPVSIQDISPAELHRVVTEAEELAGVRFQSVSTGLSLEGSDLGSRNFRTLEPPRILMPVGHGFNPNEAGQVWHLLDTRVQLPVTKIDWLHFNRADLYNYNTIVLVSGNYNWVTDQQLEEIRRWVRNGGTLIAIKSAAQWAVSNGLVTDSNLTEENNDSGSEEELQRIDFADAQNLQGAQRIGGAVFEADLDITHPLGFGYHSRSLPVYRDHTHILPVSSNRFSTVLQYTDDPHLSGYVSSQNLEEIRNSASLVADRLGNGRTILFADNPNFWGYWYGTNKLFLNAIFFGQHISIP